MNRCTITASNIAKSTVSVVVVGHADPKLPKDVAAEASRIASGQVSAPRTVVAGGHSYVLLKLKPEAWLVGGEDWRLLGKQVIDGVRACGSLNANVLVKADVAAVTALVEGALLADFRLETCRSGEAAKRKKITLGVPSQGKAVKEGVINANAQNLARELCDLPGNLMNPHAFVLHARRVCAGKGLTLKVIEGLPALRKAGFPGLCQVGQAGSTPPALIQIIYRPKKSTSKSKLALVGKGVTFDTGGISLKPGPGMWEMKGDMGGAAAVLAAMTVIAARKPKTPVTGYCVLAENMPDSRAQRPGDIYRARNGTYIHVDNTDAEGRLVLADVLTYAGEQGATHIADAATLTGACLIALGTGIAGLMGNDETWINQVRSVGQGVGEELWPLPLYGEYRKLLDHPHADINNIGGRNAGTITAGLFLKEFVDPGVKWCHVDIAGPAMRGEGWRYFGKGNTGFITRTFAKLAEAL